MIKKDKYNFSFTASSLRLNEMIMVAKHQLTNTPFDFINQLGGGKSTTGKRMLTEFNKRLSNLTESELKLLVNGDLLTQKQIAFLSICKSQAFIRDFTVEVLREKLLVFDFQITEGDFISFYRRTVESQPESDRLTENTKNKIRQVTFKIQEQAGIIDSVKNKMTQPQLLDTTVIKAIASDNKNWLKVFFMSDIDIQNVK